MFDHRVEDREINLAFLDDVNVCSEGDGSNLALKDMQRLWMEKDLCAGVGEGASGSSTTTTSACRGTSRMCHNASRFKQVIGM